MQAPSAPATTIPNTSDNSLVVDKSLITEKTYNEQDAYTTLDVVYPQFKNASAYFNKKVEDLVITAATDHQQNSKDNWQARVDTSPSDFAKTPSEKDKMSFYAKYEVVQANNKTISFLIRYGGFDGGAHGYESLQTFNYDVATQSDITLASLFGNKSYYLTTISNFARKDLGKQLRERSGVVATDAAAEANFKDVIVPMIEDGTAPTLENFSTFVFTPKEITFYFEQYQVAPYSFGESKVVMPL